MSKQVRQLGMRQQSGSSIAEFGPALFILLVIIFFPLLDMLAMGLTYTAGTILHHEQLRNAAVLKKSEVDDPSGPIQKGIPTDWSKTGIGIFASLDPSKLPTTAVSYKPGLGGDQVVEITTTLTAKPFLSIPFFPKVPGLSAPMTFTYGGERLLEDPENFKK